jgi:hypothetical protein
MKEMNINQFDADISNLPTDKIILIKNALSAHYKKALTTGEYKKEMEEMLKKYETYILKDNIDMENHLNAMEKYINNSKEVI